MVLEATDEGVDATSIVNPPDTETVSLGGFIDSHIKEQAERQAVYIQLLGQGWGRNEAARQAGYPARAARTPLKLIETPELKARMQEALERQGATLDKAARVVSEAMNANLTASFEGEVVQSEVPDHKTRVTAAKVTADFMGVTERADSGSDGGKSLTINLTGPLAERFAARMAGNVIEADRDTKEFLQNEVAR